MTTPIEALEKIIEIEGRTVCPEPDGTCEPLEDSCCCRFRECSYAIAKLARYEALQNQQKTFTVDEVREKITKKIMTIKLNESYRKYNSCEKQKVDELECLLSEFEKGK